MKKRKLSAFWSGCLATAVTLALGTTVLAASGQVEAAKIQARAPSKFPENYRDGPVFATYGANLARAITEGYKTTQTSGSADGNGSA